MVDRFGTVGVNKMKPIWSIFIGVLLLVLLYGLVPYSVWHPGAKKRRAELHMLDIVASIARENLEIRGQVPTNWMSLSNSAQWERVISFCGQFLLPPTESYAVLQRPVFYKDFGRTGEVFLVRAKPCREPAVGRGRWALAAGTILGNRYGDRPQTNAVFRIWLPEASLSPLIRSQLTNQAEN